MTLQHDSTTQSLEAWGISGAVLTLRSMAASTLSFTVAGDFDASDAWGEGDTLTLRDAANVVRFVGRVRQLPIAAQGTQESRQCVVEDVLGDLDRRTYVQGWVMKLGEVTEAQDIGAVVMFDDGSGTSTTIAAQLTAVVTAAAAAGVSVQLGTIASGLTVVPHKADVESISMLQALRLASRFAPDLGTRVDYTTTPPTLHFTRRASATEHNIAVIEHADSFRAVPLHDQRVAGVALSYERAETTGSVTINQLYLDNAPSDVDATDERVLVHHVVLRGSSVGGNAPPSEIEQVQALETTAIGAEDFTWWQRLWPDLENRNLAATLTSGSITGPSGVTKQITGGAQPSWTGSAAEVLVQATFNGIVNGQTYINKLLQAKVNASSLNSANYTTSSVSGGGGSGGGAPLEPVPTGLAALLYAGLSVLHFQGHHQRAAAEVSWTVRPGDAVNFTGTSRSDLTTAKAQVQGVELNLDAGTTRLEFGPPAHLSFADYIELLRALAPLKGQTRAGERAGTSTAPKNTVTGSGMGPGSSLIPTPTVQLHPFKVTRVGNTGNLYNVQGGTFDGIVVAGDTVDIGGTRPYYIAVVPQYELTIDGGEYVWSVTTKSGGDAPVLSGSTTEDADVTSVGSAGTGARCLIAVVTSLGVTQIATGNILTESVDDGSLTGTAQLQFDKTA